MEAREAKRLRVGDRVMWHDAGGPGVAGFDEGTIIEVMPHGLVIAWQAYKASAMPNRPLAFEHCAQVSRILPG